MALSPAQRAPANPAAIVEAYRYFPAKHCLLGTDWETQGAARDSKIGEDAQYDGKELAPRREVVCCPERSGALGLLGARENNSQPSAID
jgi:hypothetical protein